MQKNKNVQGYLGFEMCFPNVQPKAKEIMLTPSKAEMEC